MILKDLTNNNFLKVNENHILLLKYSLLRIQIFPLFIITAASIKLNAHEDCHIEHSATNT